MLMVNNKQLNHFFYSKLSLSEKLQLTESQNTENEKSLKRDYNETNFDREAADEGILDKKKLKL